MKKRKRTELRSFKNPYFWVKTLLFFTLNTMVFFNKNIGRIHVQSNGKKFNLLHNFQKSKNVVFFADLLKFT